MQPLQTLLPERLGQGRGGTCSEPVEIAQCMNLSLIFTDDLQNN